MTRVCGRRLAGLVLVVGLVAGCGSDNPHLTGADVAGMVRYQNKPVTGGTIRLVAVGDASKSASGGILGDGSYKVQNAPVGEVIVVVETESAKWDTAALLKMSQAKGAPMDPAATPTGPPKKFVAIDRKYTNPDASPARLTIEKGRNQKDVDLP